MSYKIVLAALATCGLAPAFAADETPPPDWRASYTKYEYRIPVRDGKRLFTAVYVPKDIDSKDGKSYPFLMIRTPYGCGPYGVDQGSAAGAAPNADFLKAGYIFVCQDVRGRYMSEGEWLEMHPHIAVKKGPADVDESSDTYDSVQYLLDHVKGHNGRVGLWGISYPGFYAAASVIDGHPAIKATSPQAPIADLYMNDDSYHGGALMLAANFGFFANFKMQANPTDGEDGGPRFRARNGDGYDYFLRLGNLDAMNKVIGSNRSFTETIEHDSYDDYYKARAITPHLKNIKAAVLTVGGWFDAEDLAGPFAVHHSVKAKNPGSANTLVMGPWTHGGWLGRMGKSLGRVDFAQNNSEFFQKNIMLPFFEQHLKGGADAKLPGAFVFETGSNVWRRYAAWPPQAAKTRQLYLAAKGQLSFSAPQAAKAESDSYVSDPNRPVPFVGYAAQGMPQDYMVSDQRFAATRPDVLVYQTEVLDSDMTLAGPIKARLFVSTTGTDSDFIVKLIDVYPADPGSEGGREGGGRGGKPTDVAVPVSSMGGYQQLVRANPLRARFRHGFEKPEAMVPGRVEAIDVELQDVNHSFRRGHRIMVQVQSSWFPLIDRNPQSFVTIRSAKPEDFKAATQQVYRWRDQASSLALQVLE
ncbi:MAG TPA: CocE/NonD family hydrolase [Burkholderiaceae bacterium]